MTIIDRKLYINIFLRQINLFTAETIKLIVHKKF